MPAISHLSRQNLMHLSESVCAWCCYVPRNPGSTDHFLCVAELEFIEKPAFLSSNAASYVLCSVCNNMWRNMKKIWEKQVTFYRFGASKRT